MILYKEKQYQSLWTDCEHDKPLAYALASDFPHDFPGACYVAILVKKKAYRSLNGALRFPR